MFSQEDILYKSDKYLGMRLNNRIQISVKRIDSKETYYTNDRGWRIRKNTDTEPFQSDIAIAGSSWTVGVGVDYKDSFPGVLEDKFGFKIANLSVGSTSFTQLMRYVETEIDIIKPKVLCVPYGTWLVDRCLKDRSTKLHYRPVLQYDHHKNDLVVIEPNSPPDFLIKHYARMQARLKKNMHLIDLGNEDWPYFGIDTTYKYPFFSKLYFSALEFIGKLWHGYPKYWFKKMLKLTNKERLQHDNLTHRHMILKYCLEQLLNHCKKHNTTLVLCHLYEYPCAGFEAKKYFIENDSKILKELSKELNFHYYDWKNMEANFKAYLSNKGLTIKDHYKAVTWTDNNHPNKNGHQLVAESIYPILREHLNAHS